MDYCFALSDNENYFEVLFDLFGFEDNNILKNKILQNLHIICFMICTF
jgi:hypothetical protein